MTASASAWVEASERVACTSLIRRQPRPWTALNFGAVGWLPGTAIGKEIWSLLPRGRQRFEAADVALLQEWFGPYGAFPAVHIASGELRGV